MIKIDVLRNGKDWTADHVETAKNVLSKTATFLNISGEISVLLTNDEEITALNFQYRQKNTPTNVLSFETSDTDMLGDIVLSYEMLLKEATQQDKSFDHHFSHLLIHGFLHLLGQDHQNDADAEKMESQEIDLLQTLFQIPNPYEKE